MVSLSACTNANLVTETDATIKAFSFLFVSTARVPICLLILVCTCYSCTPDDRNFLSITDRISDCYFQIIVKVLLHRIPPLAESTISSTLG